MTRNTKLYKTKTTSGKEIWYRTLSVEELSFLDGIKNDITRSEMAGKLAVYKGELTHEDWALAITIGNKAIEYSTDVVADDRIFEITVKELRKKIVNDSALIAIKNILSVMPGQSVTDLLKLTYTDLIEMVCLGEILCGKPLINFGGDKAPPKKGMHLINPADLSDEDGKTLQDKMNELNSTLRVPGI